MGATIHINKHASEADRALAWVCKAVERKEGTYRYLTGVLFVDKGEHVDVVATDGKRLHIATLHQHYVEQLGVHVADPSDTLTWEPMHLEMNKKTTIVFGNKIDIQYPDYRKVIPETSQSVGLFPNGFTGKDIHRYALNELLIRIADAGETIPRVNQTYVEDVFTDWRPDSVGYFPGEIEKRPLLFSASNDPYNRRAVIMPIRKEMR